MTGQGDAGNRWCLASTAEAAKPLRGNSMCLELSGDCRDEAGRCGTETGRQHPWLGLRAWSRHGKVGHGCVGRESNKGSAKSLVRSWEQRRQGGKRGGSGYRVLISRDTIM